MPLAAFFVLTPALSMSSFICARSITIIQRRQMEHDANRQACPIVLALPDTCNNEATEVNGRPYNEWRGRRLTQSECVKVNDILAACNGPVESNALTKLATSIGGFLDDEVRQVACRLTSHVSLISF